METATQLGGGNTVAASIGDAAPATFSPTRYDGGRMRYLCMVCFEQKTLDSLSKPEFDALVAEALAYDDELRKG